MCVCVCVVVLQETCEGGIHSKRVGNGDGSGVAECIIGQAVRRGTPHRESRETRAYGIDDRHAKVNTRAYLSSRSDLLRCSIAVRIGAVA